MVVTRSRLHCVKYKLEFDKQLNKDVKTYLISTETEEDIFEFIDYPFKTPSERNIIN